MQHQTNGKRFRTNPRPPSACPVNAQRWIIKAQLCFCIRLIQNGLVLRNIATLYGNAKGNRGRGTLGTFVRNQSNLAENVNVLRRLSSGVTPPPSLALLREPFVHSLPVTSGNVTAEGFILGSTTAHISMINSPFLVLPEGDIHPPPPP